ncbi:ABC transporter substrate-binding protein [Pseudochrobactrum kiredjianiae]|uniref:ABC transporter substrate-binding protein n=1 Tax=Pseudochrobactrum kiredjianiae TaxID=386305 RepID=A0ABW3V0A5_9HYPH|nr:ABC transporter substrate-binding protein [Pseudochrobactrum kiredjianiae]MDM7852541.1 ABC transporter substrate-binding protein [Pseudochrobactrum kiredjianiae]
MIISKWKSVCLAFLLTSTALSGALAAQDVLILARAEDPPTADPGIEISNSGYTLTYATYERLVAYKGETTEVGPQLAESWTSDDAGLVWTFKIASGHKFDDGSPVDAAAIKFSFDRLMKLKAGPSDAFPVLKEVEVVDPQTVKFILNAQFAPFISTLAVSGAAIINPKVMEHEKDGDMAKGWLAEHSAGSGAYRIASWERNQSIVLERNEHYNGAEPALKQVVMQIVGDVSGRRLKLVSGDADIIEQIPLDQAEALAKDPSVVVESNPSMYVNYIYMNNKQAPLDNVKVRQAISYAIDYQGIIDGIMLGQAKQMRGPVPSGMWGHDPDGFQYTYDVEKAKALLAESGEKNISLTYTFSQADPAWEPFGLALQAYLAEIGIKLELKSVADTTKRELAATGKYDMSPGAWTPDFADPYMFMNYWFDPDRMGGPGNRSFYNNPEVGKLVKEAASIVDEDKRKALYIEAQKISTQDAPYLYIMEKNDIFARRAVVKGYVYNPMLIQVYNFATMSKSE